MPSKYLEKILRARVYDVAEETPLEYAHRMSQKLDNHIRLKREDLDDFVRCYVPENRQLRTATWRDGEPQPNPPPQRGRGLAATRR